MGRHHKQDGGPGGAPTRRSHRREDRRGVDECRSLPERSFHQDLLTFPNHGEGDRFFILIRPENPPDISLLLDLSSIDGQNHITRHQAEGGVLVKVQDKKALIRRELLGQTRIELRQLESETGHPPHDAIDHR